MSGCGEDGEGGGSAGSAGTEEHSGSGGGSPDDDGSPPVGSCAGVTCSGHGSCYVAGSEARCACDSGFAPSTDLTCVEAGASNAPVIAGCQIFPSDHIFNTPINDLPVDPEWEGYIEGLGVNLHPDFGSQPDMGAEDYYGIPYNVVDGELLEWTAIEIEPQEDLWLEGDCADSTHVPVMDCSSLRTTYYPIPTDPLVEAGLSGESDHHLLVVDSSTCILFEFYTWIDLGGSWDVEVPGAIFDLSRNDLRPKTHTSADAAGFPVLPLLVRADEASAGEITHALRYTLSSTRNEFVWPARHYAGSEDSSLPPMGLPVRLKASFEIPADFGVQSQAILRAMQIYGMYLADNGSDMYFQGEPSAQWEERTLDELKSVSSSEFEVVDLSPIKARAGWNEDSAAVPPAPRTP